MDTLHNKIIEKACRDEGWQRLRWKQSFLKKCGENLAWEEEIADEGKDELFEDITVNPDAWRLVVEGPETPGAQWNYPVLVLEFLEVEISHLMPYEKRMDYVSLWWRFDASSSFHLRVYRAERYAPPKIWLDTETINYETSICTRTV